MMNIAQLFSSSHWPKGMPFALKNSLPGDRQITGIQYRSDQVRPGDLFVAVPGLATDGHLYAPDAAARGASILVAERPVPEAGLPTLLVDDSRKALAALSAVFYGFPAKNLTLIGVTGTNGKSTTTHILEAILREAGWTTGVMGTIDWHYPGHVEPTGTTTPESRDLQARLATMRDAGVSHVVMEVSSHAADLGRIVHTPFDVAVFTNLSQDHLDYHKTMDAYWAAKKGFLESVLDGRNGKDGASLVVNIDDPAGEALLNLCLSRTGGKGLISTARRHPEALIRPGDPRLSATGIRCNLTTPTHTFPILSPLVGTFNLDNLLSATGAAIALDICGNTIKKALEGPLAVPGRLERIQDPKGRFIFVDYAHTPDALEKALLTLKETTPGRLIVVFGCGGNRDRGKRPLMGTIAATWADLCVVTSDNPRNEDPETIIRDILQGMPSQERIWVEKDRRTAIFLAIAEARPGDAVLIAGKGHENYQIVGNNILAFDDREVARKGVLAHA